MNYPHHGIEPIPFQVPLKDQHATTQWSESDASMLHSYQLHQPATSQQMSGNLNEVPNLSLNPLNVHSNYVHSLKSELSTQADGQEAYPMINHQSYPLQQQYGGQVTPSFHHGIGMSFNPSSTATEDSHSLVQELQRVSEMIEIAPDAGEALYSLKDSKATHMSMNLAPYDVGQQSPSSVEDTSKADIPQNPTETQKVKTKKGGRKQCSVEGCTKRARTKNLCISHGGGKRCTVEGCLKSSQSRGLCIRHGGGKRCSVEGCDKGAQTRGLCKMHGGGRRCRAEGCTLSAQGGEHCRKHGGGQRCSVPGCTKGTQHGQFCGAHGGFRVCSVDGCERHDRGGGLCAKHGGGKRCEAPGCHRPSRTMGKCTHHAKVV